MHYTKIKFYARVEPIGGTNKYKVATWKDELQVDDIPWESISLMRGGSSPPNEIKMILDASGKFQWLEEELKFEVVQAIKRHFGVRKLTELTNVSDENKIIGTFIKQAWGGKRGDDAIHLGDEKFDATAAILALPLKKLRELQDSDHSTDSIGRSCVDHEGPCDVLLVDSVMKFFNVNSLKDIHLDIHDAAQRRVIEQAKAHIDQDADGPELSETQRELIADDDPNEDEPDPEANSDRPRG